MKEAIPHAKKVIHKARREVSLDILEGQVEKNGGKERMCLQAANPGFPGHECKLGVRVCYFQISSTKASLV